MLVNLTKTFYNHYFFYQAKMRVTVTFETIKITEINLFFYKGNILNKLSYV